MVAEEVVLLLPFAIAVELAARNLVEVDEWHALLCGHVCRPLCLWLSDNFPCLLIVSVAWGQRHQYRVGAGLPALGDIFSQISAIAIYGLLLSGLLDGDAERVGTHAGYHGPGASLVVGAVVVVPNGYYHPVALPQSLSDHRPQLGVEGAGAHAAKRLVLDAYLVGIEIFAGEETPSPLSVGAVALGAVAHGGVADEEQHGVVALAGGTWFRSRHQSLGYGVRSVVDDLVHILHRVGEVVKALSGSELCRGDKCNSR